MNEIAPIKSMELFTIDNQQVWGKGARLVGDYVVWPDQGIYPSYAPVGVLTHPNYDGKVVVQAGNRGIVVTFCPSARDQNDCRRILSAKERPEQYRLAVDAIVHRLILAGAGTDKDLSPSVSASHGSGLDPLAVMAWLARSAPKEAAVVEAALKAFAKSPQPVGYGKPEDMTALLKEDAYQAADDMLVTLGEVQRGSGLGA